MASPKTSPVYLEEGKSRVFACSLEWPGLCRRERDEASALAALTRYAGRYASVARRAGYELGAGALPVWRVVERVPTRSGGADFGAPTRELESDREPVGPAEAARTADLLLAAWELFDEVVAAAPAELRKGPRGGGRDRDAVVAHVRAAEELFGAKVGLDRADRGAVRQWCRAGAALEAAKPGWSPRYAGRRLIWHVLDHAWEIEDRTPGDGPAPGGK